MYKDYKNERSFRTSTRQSSYARVSAAAENRQKEQQQERAWTRFFDYGKQLPSVYRKLISRAAVCLLLVLGLFGVKALNDAATQQPEQELGRLQFVGTEQTTQYSLPMEGEVVQTFAESDREVAIKGADLAEVKAILQGTVIRTSPDSIVVNNDNGTQTTYTGIRPQVLAGDTVQSAQVIGLLDEEVLCLETVSGIGYVDSLDEVQLRQAGAQIEQ